MLSEEAKKKYIEEGGVKCPYCGDEDIEGTGIEVDCGIAWQKVYCHCGNEWTDQYKLVGVGE